MNKRGQQNMFLRFDLPLGFSLRVKTCVSCEIYIPCMDRQISRLWAKGYCEEYKHGGDTNKKNVSRHKSVGRNSWGKHELKKICAHDFKRQCLTIWFQCNLWFHKTLWRVLFFLCTFATSGDTFEEYAASFLAPNQTSQHKIREFHSSEVKTI